MSQNIKDIMNVRDVKITDLTANPAPLGLMGFGMTTVLLNLHNAGFYPMNSMILSMGLFYGGIAQVIAGIRNGKKATLLVPRLLPHTGFSGSVWWELS